MAQKVFELECYFSPGAWRCEGLLEVPIVYVIENDKLVVSLVACQVEFNLCGIFPRPRGVVRANL